MGSDNREWLNNAARIFELLAQVSVETMPEDVDFDALERIKAELVGIVLEDSVNGRLPLEVDLVYHGQMFHFKAELTVESVGRLPRK